MKIPNTAAAFASGAAGALAVALIMGLAPANSTFDEIDVERINMREPDGTIRLVISSRDRVPGLYWRGEEHPHSSRDIAGIYFMNREGTEAGGLIFTGYTDEDGVEHSVGHLSFDQYEQDQTFKIFHYQSGESVASGMAVSDRPFVPVDMELSDRLNSVEDPEERKAIIEEWRAAPHFPSYDRVFVGKSRDSTAAVFLHDAQGRHRLAMTVESDGQAAITFYDEDGEVVRTIGADDAGD